MQNNEDSFSVKLNLESFFLLIKPEKSIYSNVLQRNLLYFEIEKLINAGLKNLEIGWSSNQNWFNFVSRIKLKHPNINLGSASIVNQRSIEDSLKIGLKYSMMKFWDKDLFNYARTKNHILVPGIKNLNDLKEAINLNCKIIKIYPIKNKDDLIDIRNYQDIDFIAAGGLSIDDIENYKSLGYKSIVIGDKGYNNQKFDQKLYEWLKKNKK